MFYFSGIAITSFITAAIIIAIIVILIIACNKSIREKFMDSSFYKKCCPCLREKDPGGIHQHFHEIKEQYDDIYEKPICKIFLRILCLDI